ncbi:MAG: hypothetical protein JSR61_22440 [Proteobacteria bacterium]|nr:hypothetical protein [Pseudomonadota bacterium]
MSGYEDLKEILAEHTAAAIVLATIFLAAGYSIGTVHLSYWKDDTDVTKRKLETTTADYERVRKDLLSASGGINQRDNTIKSLSNELLKFRLTLQDRESALHAAQQTLRVKEQEATEKDKEIDRLTRENAAFKKQTQPRRSKPKQPLTVDVVVMNLYRLGELCVNQISEGLDAPVGAVESIFASLQDGNLIEDRVGRRENRLTCARLTKEGRQYAEQNNLK